MYEIIHTKLYMYNYICGISHWKLYAGSFLREIICAGLYAWDYIRNDFPGLLLSV